MRVRGRRPGARSAVVLVATLAFSTALAGCNGSGAQSAPSVTYVPATGGSIAVGIDEAPTGCNPNTAGDTWAERLVLEPVLPSAFIVGDNDQSQPDSAVIEQAELQSLTPETVVYTINPKAVWSDGVPVTAADFIYAWDEERGPALGGAADVASTQGYRDIESITGSNKGRTVTVVFSTPFADWQSLFAYLLPAHVMASAGWNPACSTVDRSIDLSAGPYMIGSVDPGHSVELVRNPRWWGPAPKLDRIVVRIASGPEQLARWMKRGSIEVADPASFDPQFLQSVTAMPLVRSQVDISGTFLQLQFSTTGPVTSSADVRLGVAHAIDRQALVDQLAAWADVNIAPSASHLYVQTQSAYPSSAPAVAANMPNPGTVPQTAYTSAIGPFPLIADPAATTKELEAAGYLRGPDGRWLDADGDPLTLSMAVDGDDGWAVETATAVVDQLERAGITVGVVTAPDAQSAGTELSEDEVDMALLPEATGPYTSETSAWYTQLLGTAGVGGSEDWSNLDDTNVDNLFVEAGEEFNPVTAEPLYTQADQLLWSEMVALPLFAQPTVLVWSDYLTGVEPNPYGPSLFWQPLTWALQVPEPVTYTGTPSLPADSTKR